MIAHTKGHFLCLQFLRKYRLLLMIGNIDPVKECSLDNRRYIVQSYYLFDKEDWLLNICHQTRNTLYSKKDILQCLDCNQSIHQIFSYILIIVNRIYKRNGYICDPRHEDNSSLCFHHMKMKEQKESMVDELKLKVMLLSLKCILRENQDSYTVDKHSILNFECFRHLKFLFVREDIHKPRFKLTIDSRLLCRIFHSLLKHFYHKLLHHLVLH